MISGARRLLVVKSASCEGNYRDDLEEEFRDVRPEGEEANRGILSDDVHGALPFLFCRISRKYLISEIAEFYLRVLTRHIYLNYYLIWTIKVMYHLVSINTVQFGLGEMRVNTKFRTICVN